MDAGVCSLTGVPACGGPSQPPPRALVAARPRPSACLPALLRRMMPAAETPVGRYRICWQVLPGPGHPPDTGVGSMEIRTTRVWCYHRT